MADLGNAAGPAARSALITIAVPARRRPPWRWARRRWSGRAGSACGCRASTPSPGAAPPRGRRVTLRCEDGRVTDLIDTTEMYLKTIFELEEEGITAPARPHRRAARPLRPHRVADRRPDGARRADPPRRRPPAAVHRARPHPGHPGHAQAPARRAAARRRHRSRVGVRPRRGVPLGARHERARRAQDPRAARRPPRLPYGNPIPGLDELGEEARRGLPRRRLDPARAGRRRAPAGPRAPDRRDRSRSTTRRSRCSPSPGCCPGEQVGRPAPTATAIIAVREGADEADGVSLPEGVAPTSSPPPSDRPLTVAPPWPRPRTHNVRDVSWPFRDLGVTFQSPLL